MSLARRSSLALAIAALTTMIGGSASMQDAARVEFEVASIKPNPSGPGPLAINTLPGGRFTATNVTLRALIQNAYRVQTVQISGGPSWINSDRFDIVAKGADQDDASRMQLRLRSLLADRFKLVIRTETREMPIYALTVARADGRLGSALHRLDVDCSADTAKDAQNIVKGAPAAAGTPCGIRMGMGTMTVGGATLAQMAASLSSILDRTVVDRTALAGTFAAALTYTPDQATPGLAQKAQYVPSIDPNGPSIFTAMQEQLGLKLEPAKAPVDLLVVIGAEKPAAN
jgi:uncharacterized protein (TIGR03435 family)